MEVISVEELVVHYLNRIVHSMDELKKSESTMKQMLVLIEQEMKGPISESLHDKLEECNRCIRNAYDDAERARYEFSSLLMLETK